MPNVVVAGERSVSTTWREWRVFHDVFIEELKRRFIAKCLEGSFTPIAGFGPKLL
jgi:hypothetical protein